PLADLMGAGLGAPGRTATAVLAVLLTMGSMNAYVAGAAKLSGALTGARPQRSVAVFAALGAVLLAPLAAGLLDVEALIRACSASFVAVYVLATAAGVRILS